MNKVEDFLKNNPDLFFTIEYIDEFKVTLRRRLYGGSVNLSFGNGSSLENIISNMVEEYGLPIQNP